jgi:hypothetical protein
MTFPIGGSIEYVAEKRLSGGSWAVMPTNPIMKSFGLVGSFSAPLEETYDETTYLRAHGDSRLERERNVITGGVLPLSLTVYPQNFDFLECVTGDELGLGDNPDTYSIVETQDSKYSVWNGIMFESFKVELPERGKAKVDMSAFAAHYVAPNVTDPVGTGTHAIIDQTSQIKWNDITELKMDGNAVPTTSIAGCIGDISFSFTSDMWKKGDVKSTNFTKQGGVYIVKRNFELSLGITYVNDSFYTLVTAGTPQNILLKLGGDTFIFKNILWPKWIGEAKPNDLLANTITCVVDQPIFTRYISREYEERASSSLVAPLCGLTLRIIVDKGTSEKEETLSAIKYPALNCRLDTLYIEGAALTTNAKRVNLELLSARGNTIFGLSGIDASTAFNLPFYKIGRGLYGDTTLKITCDEAVCDDAAFVVTLRGT